MVTASMMPLTRPGSLILATPPSLRISAGTRSSAITATAPASSAILACSAVVTSMITPPLSISARPTLSFICWSYSHIGALLRKVISSQFSVISKESRLVLSHSLFVSPFLCVGGNYQRTGDSVLARRPTKDEGQMTKDQGQRTKDK